MAPQVEQARRPIGVGQRLDILAGVSLCQTRGGTKTVGVALRRAQVALPAEVGVAFLAMLLRLLCRCTQV